MVCILLIEWGSTWVLGDERTDRLAIWAVENNLGSLLTNIMRTLDGQADRLTICTDQSILGIYNDEINRTDRLTIWTDKSILGMHLVTGMRFPEPRCDFFGLRRTSSSSQYVTMVTENTKVHFYQHDQASTGCQFGLSFFSLLWLFYALRLRLFC